MKGHTTQPLKWKRAIQLLDSMKNKPKEANTRLMIAMGIYLGLRIGDILQLQWKQITKDEFSLIEQKTKKQRSLKVGPQLREFINQTITSMPKAPESEDYVFRVQKVVRDNNKPISVTAANKRIKTTFDKYFVESANPSSHTLRKTFALRLYNVYGKCDDALILLSEMFNHANTTVTRKYIGLTDRKIKNAYLAIGSGKPIFENAY